MSLGVYRELLRIPRVGVLFIASFFARIPMLALPLVLTLYIVEGLGGTYAEAGILAAVETVGAAVGSPWRGKLIDRFGVRRALIPSLVAVLVLYPMVPFVGFWGLLPLAFLAGVFLIPVQTITRLALGILTPITQRRTAFAADSVVAEGAFIVGPAVGGVLVVQASPLIALLVVGGSTLVAGLIFFVMDPPTRTQVETIDDSAPAPVRWFTPTVGYLFAISAGTMLALMATDLGIIAALREFDAVGLVGVVYAVWGAASLVGGLLYGAQNRSIRPTYLLLAMGLLTMPIGLADSVWLLALAALPAGLMCAPSLAAATEWITHLVDERRRGVAMGWQGTAFTIGGATAGPVVGWCIDHYGALGGFAVGGGLAALIAVVALIGQRLGSQDVVRSLD
ncbi:MFS transporter [Aeromicrobium sp. YIM 150415]|uniref:MFS transporter n=1 Tax=Aeromicrobium sp. YIM 150415 TaxID=2803912 RepID=UPI001965168C|nr:MFS transporter [Aeromicrobium sp. YIM 150415]MBM9464106.1 MFS transporter [Aeromicrobium sp. YIM 150415]